MTLKLRDPALKSDKVGKSDFWIFVSGIFLMDGGLMSCSLVCRDRFFNFLDAGGNGDSLPNGHVDL